MPQMNYLCNKGHAWHCFWNEQIPIQSRVDMCPICENSSHIHLPIELLPKKLRFVNNISIRLIPKNTTHKEKD